MAKRKAQVSYRGMSGVPNTDESKAAVDFVAEALPGMPGNWKAPATIGDVLDLLVAADVIPMTSPKEDAK